MKHEKPRHRRLSKQDSEAAVLRECLVFLRSSKLCFYVERRNTGAVSFEDGGFVRFGSLGAADIWCLIGKRVRVKMGEMDDWGTEVWQHTHVEIECKRRDGKGKLSKDQQIMQAYLRGFDIPYFVVTSAEDLAEKLRKHGLIPS